MSDESKRDGYVMVPEPLLHELLAATDDMAQRVIVSPCLERLVAARAAVVEAVGPTT